MSENGVLYYERNIVDIKHEYTEYLINILIPLLYDGFAGLAETAVELNKKYNEQLRKNPEIKNPGAVKIFQMLLKKLDSLSLHKIELETNKIREQSKCAEWFDDLIRAVVKSYIILLTFNASGKKCKLVEEKFHERIDINDFIHKCYIECAKTFSNVPELFFNPDKKTRMNIYQIINNGILNAIRNIIPIKLILKEYLKNDYIQENTEEQYEKIREKIKKEILQKADLQKPLLENSEEKNNIQPSILPQPIEQPILKTQKEQIIDEPIKSKDPDHPSRMTEHTIQNMLSKQTKGNRLLIKKIPEEPVIKTELFKLDDKKDKNDVIEINLPDKEISDEEFMEKVD